MNQPQAHRAGSLALRVLRRLARPVRELQDDAARLREEHAMLAAQVEQLVRADARLVAYQDRFHEELVARYEELARAADSFRAVALHLGVDGRPDELGPAILQVLDEANVRAADRARQDVVDLQRAVADLRVSNRQTQTLLERATGGAAGDVTGGADGSATSARPAAVSAAAPTDRHFDHPTPDFELLYRAFEDRNRGSAEEIRTRQREDYLALVRSTPADDLPVVDLGCGRGELVELLGAEGIEALGVDANAGQLLDAGHGAFVESDLFDWLDARGDESVRAVCSMHVVEHLPLDLQVRLVFEARRVLAPGGLLLLETPNIESLSVGASRFWVDPTHQRPVHPGFLSFLLEEAGFTDVEARYLHPVPLRFVGPPGAERLADDLTGLLLGPGDVAVVGRR